MSNAPQTWQYESSLTQILTTVEKKDEKLNTIEKVYKCEKEVYKCEKEVYVLKGSKIYTEGSNVRR